MSVQETEQRTKEMVLAKIPALSPVILRVLDLLAQDDCDLPKLAREIQADTTLSAQVLRLANSALFGFPYQIDTVQKAVVAVGNAWIQQLAVSVAAGSYMQAAKQTKELGLCWRHTLATAVLCREIARVTGVPAERAYTVGLLHDIGRLGLLSAFPEEFVEIVATADGDPAALLAAERERFCDDHCQIGQWLMEDWHLPRELALVVGRHHEAIESGRFDVLRAVQLACRLADTLGYAFVPPKQGMSLEEVRALLPEHASRRFPSEPAVLTGLIDDVIAGRVAHWTEPVEEAPEPEAAPPVVENRRRRFPWWAIVAAVMAVLAVIAFVHNR